jgi:membrane-associated protein
MDHILNLFGFTDMADLVRWCGYIGLAIIVFAETGVLAGFFLPGDSLLVTAGLFAARGDLDIWYLNLLLIPMAVIGDAFGYWFGAKAGSKLYERPDSRFFKRKHLIAAHQFYEKHGGKTIVLARFVPIIRTFAPVVAGAAQMTYRRFAMFNVFGGLGWVTSMTLVGYFLGTLVPGIDKHIEKVIVIVVLLSISPGIYAFVKSWWARRKERRQTAAAAATETD